MPRDINDQPGDLPGEGGEKVPPVVAELLKVAKVWDWWLDDAGDVHARMQWHHAWPLVREAESAGEMWAIRVKASALESGCVEMEAFITFDAWKVWIHADGGGVVEFSR